MPEIGQTISHYRIDVVSRLSALLCMALLTMAPSIYASNKVWSSCKGPGAGYVRTLAIDPQNTAIVYAGADEGLYKSTDGGMSWEEADSGLRYTPIQAVVIDPQNPATLYAAVGNSGVFKSTNGGSDWTILNDLATTDVLALAIDPQNPANIYAATYLNGIFKSTDGGAHWIAINNGVAVMTVQALVINPQNPAILYAGSQDIFADRGAIYRSVDGGAAWSEANNGLTSKGITALAIDSQDPSIVYAGTTSGGVFKSTDAGASWNGIGLGRIISLAIDPNHSGVLYAGVSDYGIFRSTDGGAGWSAVNNGATENFIKALSVDPQNSSTVYAGSSHGIFKTTNAGESWSSANSGFFRTYVSTVAIDPQNQATIYAGGIGVYKSTDGGASWTVKGLTRTVIEALAVNPQDSAVVYAATRDGVYKSNDGGSSWRFTVTGGYVKSLAIDPQNPATVYAGTYDHNIYRSTDSGASWNTVGPALWLVYALAIDPQNPATVYAGTGSGIYKSTDSGSNWTASGLENTGINTLAIDLQNSSTIYAGTNLGVYKTTNGGVSWIAANKGLSEFSVLALAINTKNPAILYAGTYLGGVFRSSDGGANWSAINAGLKDSDVHALAIDPVAPQRVYAGTNSTGVWAIYISTCSASALSLGPGGTARCDTGGSAGEIRAGYAKLSVNSGATPYGTAVFTFRQNGVTVSEAGIPASPPTTRAQIFIEYRTAVDAVPGHREAGKIDVNTGIAAVNSGSAAADVTYNLRDISGALITIGHGSIAAGGYFACFIDQLRDRAAVPDFGLPADFLTATQFGSLEIASSQPLSVLGLRGTINQSNEFLMTSTPVADLTKAIGTGPIYFPQFVDGGGYTTSVILLNTSSVPETGTLEIIDANGAPLTVTQVGGPADSSFRYSIQPDGVFRFQTDGFPAEVKSGWLRLMPDSGTLTPIGSGVFSYNPETTLVSESGIASAAATTHARVYVDRSSNHNTGLAIANISDARASVVIRAFQEDGIKAIGTSRGPLSLLPHGYSAAFADQFVTGFPAGFTGVLDISATTPFAALTVRSLMNEENKFIMSTFPVADLNAAAPSPVVFPQVSDGGGYVTEFILISAGEGASADIGFRDESGALADFGE
jgi:photosystem II stability/assembly factor-like uncharacterized protein